jgi:hypothetical protein
MAFCDDESEFTMISIQRTSGSGLSKLLIGLLVVAAVVGIWFFMPSDEVPPGGVPADSAMQSSPVADASLNASSGGNPMSTQDGSSPDTAALNTVMSAQQDGEKQLDRVLSYLKFQREFERWQGMQGEASEADLAALGTRLLNDLPQYVASRSMTQPEGDFMCGMILSSIEANPAMQETRIASCQAAVKAVAPAVDTQEAMNRVDCEADYRARESTLVAAFQALPSARRDPAKLQADLDQAHEAVYREPRCKQ